MEATRRQFLLSTLKTASAVGLGALVLGLYSRQSRALPAPALRPPGALAEEDFLGACVRCGLCVRDCPYDTLKLAKVGETVALGTPYFTAREIPCEMCEDIPCVKACPTGALNHDLTDINQSRMGLAVVVDQEGCIAFQGLRCEVCYNVCPVRGKAITLEKQHNARTGRHAFFIPVVHSSDCTGCGKCEEACIVDGEAAIKVIPTHLAKSGGSGHYRFGWKEKAKHGGEALVAPDTEHKFNLPEGMRYDYEGKGLVIDPQPQEGLPQGSTPPAGSDSPFPDNPLETLNRKGAP
ncbi:ferredoxin-type protein NapG [Thiothrix nivea]|uniref:Periplasmic nitrate reductase subunit NapG n=1 Tax=Thiothrix nivea (strain ATCC 35100 / DSM 5205 / JP2) TaxID=870187 RepID=A0A656HFS1_THINJ|nr:ferredoxin-type protein NapG [Thiothrix nivea]EIJ33865.1 periplasmic nitrate reductase subunit NapG [Thiothrix nivea DSM 5205]